jgi:transposase-like protein
MKYSKGFKSSIVRRVVEHEGKSIYQVSKETGICAATITSWIEKHKAGKLVLESSDELTPSQRSPGEKLSLLLESKTLDDESRGQWLRQQGLHSEHLPLWEQELAGMVQDKQSALKSENITLKKEKKQLEKDLKAKERELAIKEKALADVAVLLTLKKNIGICSRRTRRVDLGGRESRNSLLCWRGERPWCGRKDDLQLSRHYPQDDSELEKQRAT